MARVKGKYKVIAAQTKNMGSAGAQIQLGTLTSVDPQTVSAYIGNIKVACLQNDGDGDNGGFIVYATTRSSWDDSSIVAFGATGSLGGICRLGLSRWIKRGEAASGLDGTIYLWAEVTDLGTTQNDARFVWEVWGKGHVLTLT